MRPSLPRVCKARRGDGTVLFSAANQPGTAMARSSSLQQINRAPLRREEEVAPGWAARDATGAFLVRHPQRMSTAEIGRAAWVHQGSCKSRLERGGSKSSAREEGIVSAAHRSVGVCTVIHVWSDCKGKGRAGSVSPARCIAAVRNQSTRSSPW